MKITRLIAFLIILICNKINAQQFDSFESQPLFIEAMKNIRIEKDEFAQSTLYYSKRTPKNQNDFYDRFFLYIKVPDNNGVPRLFLEISHSDQYRRGDYYKIKTISLLSDGKPLDLPMDQGRISGNGSQQAIFTMGFGKKPYYFDFIKGMVNAQNTKARIVTPKDLLIDFDISSRERKALNDIIALWEIISKK